MAGQAGAVGEGQVREAGQVLGHLGEPLSGYCSEKCERSHNF